MRLIVPAGLITFNPTAKTITLASPFNQVVESQVLTIRDDTTGENIYERVNPKNPITVAAGVITYTYDSAHQLAADDLQVELEFGYYSPRVVIYSTQAVAAGQTNNSTTKLYVEGAASIWLMASETGASGVTINVYPYETSAANAGACIQTATISATVKASTLIETGLPYISLSAINGDGANAASVTAALIITWR